MTYLIHSNLAIFLYFIIIIIIIISVYGYHSGSCKIKRKDYKCDTQFCLYKQFKLYLPSKLDSDFKILLKNKKIQNRVSISSYIETIFNCALPNKKGITISTNNIIQYAPNIIHYYKYTLPNIISKQLGVKVTTTSLNMPTSCALLIYEKEGDWINWHYDYNYYDGRFFTLLIPITNQKTCTRFQYKNDKNEVISLNIRNNDALCFEGNYLYHRASKLCKNQKRVLLSCQFVTNNNMSYINKLRIKLKDFAYTGKL